MASLLLDNQASLPSRDDDEEGVFLPSKLNGQGKNERSTTMAHRYHKELCLGDYVYWGGRDVGGSGNVSIIDNTGLGKIIIFFLFLLQFQGLVLPNILFYYNVVCLDGDPLALLT